MTFGENGFSGRKSKDDYPSRARGALPLGRGFGYSGLKVLRYERVKIEKSEYGRATVKASILTWAKIGYRPSSWYGTC